MDSKLVNQFMNAGLSFFPVNEQKRPLVDGWKQYQTRRPDPEEIASMPLLHSHGVAIVAGEVSGGIEVIDIDVKNDPTGRVWDEFRAILQQKNPDLYAKLTIQRTMSGGYHIIYRCPSPGRNQKLAWHEFDDGSRKEIIETRAEGGYFVVWPTPRYELIMGNLPGIETITQDERDELIDVGKSIDRTTIKVYRNTRSGEKSDGARDTALRAITQIEKKQLNITDSYEDWLNIGFALADEFGEEGRELYHTVSKFDHRYDEQNVNKAFDTYLDRTQKGIEGKTIRTFLAICHRNGIDVADKQDKKSKDEMLLDWVKRQNFKYNVCTSKIHVTDQQELTDHWANKLYFDCRRDLGFNVPDNMFKKALENIDNLEQWNPIRDCFNGLQFWDYNGDPIEEFLDTIEYKDNRMRVFIRKWLLSVVATAYGNPQEYCLVLIGPQGVGKTEFFMRLLPKSLRRYCVIDQLDQGKDSAMIMCSNLIVVDDEWEGKSKKDAGHFKSLTTKKEWQIRSVYGRYVERKPRLCMFAGCSNQPQILNDTTGNRRILPVEAISRDFKKSDAINRNDLWAALVQEYFRLENSEGYRLSSEEISFLFERSDDFQLENPAKVAIASRWMPCRDSDPMAEKITVNDMLKVIMEDNPYLRITNRQLGVEASQLGFEQWRSKHSRGYIVKERVDEELPSFGDTPF